MAHRIQAGSTTWDWRMPPNTTVQLQELQGLLPVIHQFIPNGEPDSWKCMLAEDGRFYVREIRQKIDQLRTPSPVTPITWLMEVPIKINCFVWRANIQRIPSAVALSTRGIAVDSLICKGCITEEEDSNHILFNCPCAKMVWSWIANWCNIQFNCFQSVSDILNFAYQWTNCAKRRATLLSICYETLWWIWRARNDRIFKSLSNTPTQVMDVIQAQVFCWIKHRRKQCSIKWAEWSACPLNCN